jgi:hypothetical protein
LSIKGQGISFTLNLIGVLEFPFQNKYDVSPVFALPFWRNYLILLGFEIRMSLFELLLVVDVVNSLLPRSTMSWVPPHGHSTTSSSIATGATLALLGRFC